MHMPLKKGRFDMIEKSRDIHNKPFFLKKFNKAKSSCSDFFHLIYVFNDLVNGAMQPIPINHQLI